MLTLCFQERPSEGRLRHQEHWRWNFRLLVQACGQRRRHHEFIQARRQLPGQYVLVTPTVITWDVVVSNPP